MTVGIYLDNDVNKKSDMNLAAKVLGAKVCNNSLKTKLLLLFFFFIRTTTTHIYTLSLHDALPISPSLCGLRRPSRQHQYRGELLLSNYLQRSEEHTSELQSRLHLVCRLLLEKKK